MTKKDTLNLAVGTLVYCTVAAVRGWYRVTAIRPRDGYIKIDGFNTWNPPHNFSATGNICGYCNHLLDTHKRHASGAYRCSSSGCGCERADVEIR